MRPVAPVTAPAGPSAKTGTTAWARRCMRPRIALSALFGRLPNPRVEDDARFRSYHLIHGLASPQVAW
jgi:hypothetical protein